MKILARWLARRIWWGSLWLMRRRWMRRLQRASMAWMAPARAERARQGLIRQNAFARRIGLPTITVLLTVLLASLAIQVVYSSALYLVESGVLRSRRLPEE